MSIKEGIHFIFICTHKYRRGWKRLSLFIGWFSKVLVFTSKKWSKLLTATVPQYNKQNCDTWNWVDKSVANVQIDGKSKSLRNQSRFYHYTTFHFILRSVLFYNQLLSTKKQSSRLCKLYSVCKVKPGEFLDKTYVDSYVYQNILDI